VHLAGPSQLASGNGDIIVFLPRNLAVTIDATVTNGGLHRIEADPSLHFIVQASNGLTGPVHATAVLNGGGPPLKLRSTAGKIRLQYLDSEVALRDSLIREQIERISQRIPDFKPDYMDRKIDESLVIGTSEAKTDWLESWLNSLEIAVRGGMTEDAEDFQKRLINFPKPSYPALAQRAGLQGFVKLQVRVKKDGSVEVQKLLEGEPALADAAIAAVKTWRAKPAWMNGKPVEVISTVTFNFQLH
jgi:TonB family protein